MTEAIIVALVVTLAVAYSVFRLVRFFKNAGRCSGGCERCTEDMARRLEEDQ